MKVVRLLSCIICILVVPAVEAADNRSESDGVEGVPSLYWPLFRGGIPQDEVAEFRAKLPYESVTLDRIFSNPPRTTPFEPPSSIICLTAASVALAATSQPQKRLTTARLAELFAPV